MLWKVTYWLILDKSSETPKDSVLGSSVSDSQEINITKDRHELSQDLLDKVKSNPQKLNLSFNKLINLYNKLFQRKYRHVLYSRQFRDSFQLFRINDPQREPLNTSNDVVFIPQSNSLRRQSYNSEGIIISNQDYSMSMQTLRYDNN